MTNDITPYTGGPPPEHWRPDGQSAATMKALAAALMGYPSSRPASVTDQAAMLRVYAWKLRDIPPDVVDAAVDVCGGTWFPSVDQIRVAAAKITTGLLTEPDVESAWKQVGEAIAKHGAFQGFTDQVADGMTARDGMPNAIADPIAQSVVSALGWNALCMSDNPTADRARFIEMYRDHHRRAVERARIPPGVHAMAGQLRVASGGGTLKQLMSASEGKETKS